MAVKAMQETDRTRHMKERLLALLSRAREIKQSTDVEPELPPGAIIEDVRALGVEFGGGLPLHSLVEAAAQDIIYDCLVSSVQHSAGPRANLCQTSTSIDDPEFVQIWDLLDIIQIGEDTGMSLVLQHDFAEVLILSGQCKHGQVALLLENLFDTQTTSGCRKVFQYLESRRSRIVAREWDAKFMTILRSCNELLRRRLSRAEDAVFCGRVFFFLFQAFPLGDKSSVNLRGEFHTANTTTYEEVKPGDMAMKDADSFEGIEQSNKRRRGEDGRLIHQPDQQETKAQIESIKEAITSSTNEASAHTDAPQIETKAQEKVVSNDELYSIFWRMQEYFSEPPKLFAGDRFSQFKYGLLLTIAKFKSIPPDMQQNTAGVERGTKRKRVDGTDTYRDVYNPKYLTDRELFDLEVREFRNKIA